MPLDDTVPAHLEDGLNYKSTPGEHLSVAPDGTTFVPEPNLLVLLQLKQFKCRKNAEEAVKANYVK